MELANQAQNKKMNPPEIRVATRSDAANIMDLLQISPYRHIHVDWHLPGDWIGAETFLIQVQTEVASDIPNLVNRMFSPKVHMQSCLAVTADPLPAAWVRLAAVANELEPQEAIHKLLEPICKKLKREQITEIGWLAIESWPNTWLPKVGFNKKNEIITYRKTDTDIPQVALRQDVEIRPVAFKDLERLAEIEALAFDPLWRHSVHALQMARSQAFSFDVALYQEELVGFQLSARGQRGVHLARLTIDPSYQGTGIGSTLLAHAFVGYHNRGLYDVSLNTPSDNLASKILYEKFGFEATQDIFPVWVMNL